MYLGGAYLGIFNRCFTLENPDLEYRLETISSAVRFWWNGNPPMTPHKALHNRYLCSCHLFGDELKVALSLPLTAQYT